MPPYFSQRRNVELSTVQYLETQFGLSWTGITVVKTFTQAYDTSVNPPIICIQLTDTQATRKEVGSVNLSETYTISVDIFARSHGQRIDLAAFILDKLKNGWTYNMYSHPSGNPEGLSSVASGRVFVTNFLSDIPINFGQNVDVKDRFRHSITCLVRVSTT